MKSRLSKEEMKSYFGITIGITLCFSSCLAIIVRAHSLMQCEGSFASCLIQALEFDIPDSSTVIGFETLRIQDLTCQQGQIGGLDSSYVHPSGLNGVLTGVKLHCDGKYSYGAIKGHLNAAISISALSLDSSVLVSTTSEYPGTLTTSSCSVNSFDIKLSFSGGIAGSVLNLISPLAESYIRDNVKKQACAKLTQLVSTDGTETLISRVDPTLQRLIDLGKPDSEYPNKGMSIARYMHWSTSLLSTANHFLFYDYSGRIGKCFFGNELKTESLIEPDTDTTLPVPMDSIISYYTNGTGSFSIPLGSESILPVPSKVTPDSTIKFTKLSVSGLESLTVTDLLHPSLKSNISMTTTLFIGHLDTALNFSFCSIMNGKEICDNKNSSIIMKLANITVEVICSVGAVQSKLNALTLDQLTSLPFWLSTIDFFNITSLNFQPQIESIIVRGDGSDYSASNTGKWTSDLDTGISYLLDNAIMLLVKDYTDVVDSVISAAIQGPVRNTVNAKIAEILRNNKDVHRRLNSELNSELNNELNTEFSSELNSNNIEKKGDNLVINWAEFEPLMLFRSIADEVTADDLNRFVKCLVVGGSGSTSAITSTTDEMFTQQSKYSILTSQMQRFITSHKMKSNIQPVIQSKMKSNDQSNIQSKVESEIFSESSGMLFSVFHIFQIF